MATSNLFGYNSNSLFGGYFTRKFSDIYPTLDAFLADFTTFSTEGLNPAFINNTQTSTVNTINIVYYLLSARYGYSHIAGSSEDLFKLRLFTIIYQYGPTWEKRLNLQLQIRSLDLSALREGNVLINNVALNPSTAPTTSTMDELTHINQQNVNKYKRNALTAYSEQWDMLETDVSEEFIDRFKSLFIKIVQPQTNLWYTTELDENTEDIV